MNTLNRQLTVTTGVSPYGLGPACCYLSNSAPAYNPIIVYIIEYFMKALLFVAHGSRKETSNEEIRQLTLSIKNKSSGFDLIEHAFLELVEPDIFSGGQKLIDQGASSIVVYPYFLVAGKHVVTDVPEDVEKIKASNPGVEITIAPYFGASATMVDQILSQLIAPKQDDT